MNIETMPNYTPRHITLHWSAGKYQTVFSDYHFNILGDGTIEQTKEIGAKLPHTWNRNTDNVGISICAMFQAQFPENLILSTKYENLFNFEKDKQFSSYPPNQYGSYPPTKKQLDSLVKLCAYLTRKFGWDFNRVGLQGYFDTYQKRERVMNIFRIMSHAEWALMDEYGVYSGDPFTRWDLFYEMPLLRKEIEAEYVRTKPIR